MAEPAPYASVEELLRARLSELLGGWRGAIEAALPGIAFVVAWNLTSDVRTSVLVSVGVALAVGAVRLLQGQTLRYVGLSLIGVAVAGFFAMRSGRAQDAYLPGILQTAGTAALYTVTNLIRWPVFGFLIAAGDPDLAQASARVRQAGSLQGRATRAAMSELERAAQEERDEADAKAMTNAFTSWRAHAGIVTVAQRLGWVMVGLSVLRLAVQVPLYLQGQVEALGLARIVLGWPAYAAAVAVAALVVLRGHTPLDSPVAEGD